MARHRNTKKGDPPNITYAQPDRSGPDPSHATLLEMAAQRGLLKTETPGEETGEPEVAVGRVAESILWSMSMAMLHFTLDVLVTHQYSMDLVWRSIILRSIQSFGVSFILFYTLHPHPEPSYVLPNILPAYQPYLHQLLFFATSAAAGCYLIYITNVHGYYAVMKQAPSLGVLWIWSVIELELMWALPSLMICLIFLWLGGYSYL